MKNKLKVYDLTVTNYDFTGYILMPDDRTLDVEGEFYVTFYGQYPDVHLGALRLATSNEPLDLNDLVDIKELLQQIENTDDGSWYYDHCDSMTDRMD
jgi:hypothetical protein